MTLTESMAIISVPVPVPIRMTIMRNMMMNCNRDSDMFNNRDVFYHWNNGVISSVLVMIRSSNWDLHMCIDKIHKI